MIKEFVLAANTVQWMALVERRRPLERGAAASEALRGLLTKSGEVAPMGDADERVIEDIALHIDEVSDETVARALLALASQISTLRILNRQMA